MVVVFLLPMSAKSQKYIIQKTNGQQVILNYEDVESIIFCDAKELNYEFVDLGLSVKWATCNVGASSPEDYGLYFAWGETLAKDFYGVDNSVTAGKDMQDISSNVEYDAATANIGGGARMPTMIECLELMEKCEWTFTNLNGVNGMRVKGPNGNSIFMPAAGKMFDKDLVHDKNEARYWSSTPYDGKGSVNYAYGFAFFEEGGKWEIWEYRGDGQTIRAVCD